MGHMINSPTNRLLLVNINLLKRLVSFKSRFTAQFPHYIRRLIDPLDKVDVKEIINREVREETYGNHTRKR